MSIKIGILKTIGGDASAMVMNVMSRFVAVLFLCNTLLAGASFAQSGVPFKASLLVNKGDSVRYGSYIVIKLGEGLYKINDPGTLTAIKGGAGVDMYMICGKKKALMIDLGNNYMIGYEKDLIAPRVNAAEELRNVAYGLAGKLPLEIAFTHTGPDHQGMTNAFINRNITMWMAEGEDLNRPMGYFTSDPIDTSVYTRFKHGEKSFDLGGGRVVETIKVRGHTNAGTVFILKKEGVLISGDAIGFGNGLGLDTVDEINGFKEDIQNLVDYIFANFSSYERYAMRAYTGHSHLDFRGSIRNQDNIDAGYMDWRYIQNMASCANAIAKGMWLVEGSPLLCVRRQPTPGALPAADEVVTMVYGIGALKIPIGLAYEVAGLKMAVTPFNTAALNNIGDSVKYSSYIIIKLGEGIYKINDPGTLESIKGGRGVDMYMVCGEQKALMIDLGNNYIDGYEKDLIPPRKKAAEDLHHVVQGLIGKLPLEIAITHMHPDHDGMTGAFLDWDVTFWVAEGEDINRLQVDHKNLDPSVYKIFKAGEKTFDLGGGRTVETFLVRGHSNGGTVYMLKKEGMLFSGDALGFKNGARPSTADNFMKFKEDIQNLVDYILANFSSNERYALKVYSGHSHIDIRDGYSTPNLDDVDMGYLDWRFIQNMASCANGIVKGMWLVEGSGLRYIRQQPGSNNLLNPADEVATMVCGISSIKIPIGAAYEAAGLKMPKTNGK